MASLLHMRVFFRSFFSFPFFPIVIFRFLLLLLFFPISLLFFHFLSPSFIPSIFRHLSHFSLIRSCTFSLRLTNLRISASLFPLFLAVLHFFIFQPRIAKWLPHHQHRLVASLSTNSLQYVAIGNFGWPTQNKKSLLIYRNEVDESRQMIWKRIRSTFFRTLRPSSFVTIKTLDRRATLHIRKYTFWSSKWCTKLMFHINEKRQL